MTIPFIDLTQEFDELHDEWFNEIKEIATQGNYILGHHVHAFEQESASYIGSDYTATVANGTDALTLSLRALDIGSGDEVITSPFSFMSSAESICHVGAKPVFADIDYSTFNITAETIRHEITDKTRAIVVVHLFGMPADMVAIKALAKQHNLKIIEDAAQAFGATFDNERTGSFGDLGCFSFYPTKVLGCYGDGGLISTSSNSLLEKIHRLKNHGAIQPFIHAEIGYNSRLDEIQAALLRIKLKRLDNDISKRKELAQYYFGQLKDTELELPNNDGHVYNLYTIRIKNNRDAVRQYLSDKDIPSSLCYPQLLPSQPVFAQQGYQTNNLSVAEQATKEVLSLPVYPAMTTEAIDIICSNLKTALLNR